MRILFLCLGNICRSPTAEGVLRQRLRDAGLGDVDVESAGTGSWHIGHPPDDRAAAAALTRGITLDSRAQRLEPSDFDRFDLILAMDRDNVAEAQAVAPSPDAAAKLRLFREYDPIAVAAGELDVPDPYYGGDDGFEDVLDMIERACDGLIAEIRSARAAGA
ncbi:MAG TPA: low molecular weight protein-tyrosine-phosphatase [Solirubrobacterales bacterium]|nr:low molecular weight protein-tyrosine-phosphatase [Solirubrobacterales bacterium]